MHFGEKEFFPHPSSTTRSPLLPLCKLTCHRFLPDDNYIAILTGIPWYQPVLTNFNATLNFRQGPPCWPLPVQLLQTSPLPLTQTLFMYLSYCSYHRPPKSSTYYQASIHTSNIPHYFNRHKPMITQTSTDKNLLHPA